MPLYQYLRCQATHPANDSRSYDARCEPDEKWCSFHSRWEDFFRAKLNEDKGFNFDAQLERYPDDPGVLVRCFNMWSSMLALRVIITSLFHNHCGDTGHTKAVKHVVAQRDNFEWKLLRLGSLNHPEIKTVFMYLEVFAKGICEDW